MITRLRSFILICALSLRIVVRAHEGLTNAPIDQALGRSGQKAGDAYRVGFPRTDLYDSVNGVAISQDSRWDRRLCFPEPTATPWRWAIWCYWRKN